MKILKAYIAQSADGYIAYPDGDLNWIPEIIRKDFIERYNSADILILGSTTYREVIERSGLWNYNSKETYVVSKFNTNVSESQNVRFLTDNPMKQIKKIKSASNGDIIVMGGGKLVESLISNNLLDELVLIIIPTELGDGIPFFPDLNTMELSEERVMQGIITKTYQSMI